MDYANLLIGLFLMAFFGWMLIMNYQRKLKIAAILQPDTWMAVIISAYLVISAFK